MAVIHYCDDPKDGFDVHYFPTNEVTLRLQKMAAQYMERFDAITEKEAIEACVDGILEEGWELPRL